MFVHRNVGNLVVHSDLNCLAVPQYAVDVLRVRNIIVCGHYGCGGVRAALEPKRHGLIDNWLRHIQDIELRHMDELKRVIDPAKRADRVCELSVVEQVRNVARTTVLQEAWARGQSVAIHAWVYALSDGLIRDLGVTLHRTPPTGLDAVSR
jgi:carbonic anhydrase